MMLYKLSISNIKKSFKDYAIYFITLILGICIFYIFNSLDSQTAMMEVSSSTKEIINLLMQVLSGVSIFVSCVLGFLIIYASRFLIKKRNKEFGIYLTLGMSKRKISLLLLLETLLIGIISLVIGLIIGILLSQVTSIFIANLFEANLTKYTFNFSSSATIKTIIYFGIIYFIVMVFNTIVIRKCKLIDLLQASKKTEKVKLKNPILCTILFLTSIGLLSYAYYMVTGGVNDLLNYSASIIFIPVSMGIIGTVFFFFSISGLALRIVSKIKKLYYKGLNSFIFKEISSKINTMVISISIICIMLFFTICILSSALSIKNYFNSSILKLAPTDFEVIVDKNEEGNDIDLEKLYKDEEIEKELKNMVTASIYRDSNFTLGKSYGKYFKTLKNQYTYMDSYWEDFNPDIMKLSDYKKLVEIFKIEDVNLKDDEYAIVVNYEPEMYDKTMELGSILNINNHLLKPGKEKTTYGFYSIEGNPTNIGFFVVPDKVLEDMEYSFRMITGNYKTKDMEKQNKLNDKIFHLNYHSSYSYNSKIDIKDSCVGLSAIVTFIGLYLGIIFLISSAAILSLKELSDSIDNRDKYEILRRIGTDEAMINKALFKQSLLFFMLPLMLAIVHTIFGIKFCLFILKSIGIDNLFVPIFITFLFLILIYGIYFIITFMCSKNIIKER